MNPTLKTWLTKITTTTSKTSQWILDKVLGPKIDLKPGDWVDYGNPCILTAQKVEDVVGFGGRVYAIKRKQVNIWHSVTCLDRKWYKTTEYPVPKDIRFLNRSSENITRSVQTSRTFLDTVRVIFVAQGTIGPIIQTAVGIVLAVIGVVSLTASTIYLGNLLLH
jgi:hypothetical protein